MTSEIFVDLLLDFILAWLAFCWGYWKGRTDELKWWIERRGQEKKGETK